MIIFRVHYAGGDYLDVPAKTPAEARTIAVHQKPGHVTRVKVWRA